MAGYVPSDAMFIDLLSHFRLQFFIGALLGTLLSLAFFFKSSQGRWISGLCLSATLMNGWALLPYVPNKEAQINLGSSFKVTVANVDKSNRNYEAIWAFVREENPDLLVVIEANDYLVEALQPLRSTYAYAIVVPSNTRPGMIVLSRSPLEEVNISEPYPGEVTPTIFFKWQHKGQLYPIAAIHANWPLSFEQIRLRNLSLDSIAAWVKAQSLPAFVVGDLNMTPFTTTFDRFLEESGLTNTRQGWGYLPTWGLLSPWSLRLPIDHILASPDIQVMKAKVGPDIGSDHCPLVMEFRTQEQQQSSSY